MSKITPFGKLIRKSRIDLNVTLRSMANSIGISPAYLSAIENGKRDATSSIVSAIAEYIGISDELELSDFLAAAMSSNKKLMMSLSELNEDQRNLAVIMSLNLSRINSDNLNEIRLLINDINNV